MSEQKKHMPEGTVFEQLLRARHKRGTFWGRFFLLANGLALVALVILLLHIANQSFGLVVSHNNVDPATLADHPLDELSEAELMSILVEQQPGRLLVIMRDKFSQVPAAEYATTPLQQVLKGLEYPAELADTTVVDLTLEERATILSANLSQSQVYDLVISEIVKPTVIKSWRLLPSLLDRAEIEALAAAEYPDATLEFKSWISLDFVLRSVSSSATTAGLRTALLGSAWIILITVFVAFPLGVGAAIYLEEYARKTWFNQLIEINIRNLAAVPSIIYGMLGLAMFVRSLGDLTSGAAFGVTDSNGRTVISAGFTLALLVLPVVIINAQEAIRAVPSSIREASYGLGATKWQTIQHQVLPAAMPGILTGIILSMSRAVGETAPLIVVGASTFIGVDPNGPFSKFTVVPIQIFQWTSRPEQEFRNVAAAAIIVLLVVIVLLNGTAIVLRNHFSRRTA